MMETETFDKDGEPRDKRIKLEHSYATDIKTEIIIDDTEEQDDPLNIFPSDIDRIKKETEESEETIVIKAEPDPEENDVKPDVSLIEQNDDRPVASDSLMDVVKSVPCKSSESQFFDSLGRIHGEVDVSKSTSGVSLHVNNVDVVPKHVFLELQRMYEKTMAEAKNLEKKLKNEKKKKAPRTTKNDDKSTALSLQQEVKILKQQLMVSKSKIEIVKNSLDTRSQEEAELKRTNSTLKQQMEELVKISKIRNETSNQLKSIIKKQEDEMKTLRNSFKDHKTALKKASQEHQENMAEHKAVSLQTVAVYQDQINKQKSAMKDLQEKLLEMKNNATQARKEKDAKCSLYLQKLSTAGQKLALQHKEMEKLKLDMEIMDQSINDSLRTRQTLEEQVVRMEKELQAMKDNPSLTVKYQEAQKALSAATKRADELRATLVMEKEATARALKEKQSALIGGRRVTKENEVQINLLKHTVNSLKKSIVHKLEQSKALADESRKVNHALGQTKEECAKKDRVIEELREQLRTKTCEYCGF
ncbi:hypothetical protein NQ317_002147 [Molorchus minor]|uniref:Uncharacterized protein n=1 Tax=Molorchus minor TaxID=1323400 RepID=A0ABQ9JV95_9CUCU|nr:hypothetical protein NQ317_002147 [Molorchus minor]